ncbi:MAG: Hint domain-containing protein, partial [Acidiphilium sp.]|nr:Hint domain-containing protein [Acidiphilium sp.]
VDSYDINTLATNVTFVIPQIANFSPTSDSQSNPLKPSATGYVNNFGSTDSILIEGFSETNIVSPSLVPYFDVSGTPVTEVQFTLDNPAGGTESQLIDIGFAPTVSSAADIHYTNVTNTIDGTVVTGVEITVCFLPGTRLLGAAGEIAVETLQPGDELITASGALRPIRWIGHRTIDATRHPKPETVWPIRIEAGAIADGLPARTLHVSPDHALFIDGALIPAKALVNGSSIVQERRDSFTYYHVELDSHDILLADSMPVESYLDTGNRNFFDGNEAPTVLHPDFAQSLRVETGCAPFMETGDLVHAVRARILARLAAPTMTQDAQPVAVSAGLRLPVISLDQSTLRIDLPATACDITLSSRAMVPAWIDGASEDRRSLGLDVASLTLETATGTMPIDRDSADLVTGWHVHETGHRWTDGAAIIPAHMLEGGNALIIRLNSLPSYPVVGRQTAAIGQSLRLSA